MAVRWIRSPPGGARIYTYEIPVGSAGTYWYHPHAHQTTALQVARGLAAPLIVRGGDDPLSMLPEVTLFISGVRLDGAGQVSPMSPVDAMVGRQGEALLVNGKRLPVHNVRPGATQRWRILNATSAHYLRLSLEGHTLTLVGTDGGLLAAPQPGQCRDPGRAGAAGRSRRPRERHSERPLPSPGPAARHGLHGLRCYSTTT